MKETINNHINFYDVGYRLAQKHWGKGYATESAKASLRYAFEEMNLTEVFGITHIENIISSLRLIFRIELFLVLLSTADFFYYFLLLA